MFGYCAKRPYSFGAAYAGGPVSVGIGYNNPGNVNDHWLSARGSYDLGAAKLWVVVGSGKNTANAKVKSYEVAATVPMGQGEFRAGLISLSTGGVKSISGVGLGYHYALSKRTTLYTDFARNGKAATEKVGYDVGVKHAF